MKKHTFLALLLPFTAFAQDTPVFVDNDAVDNPYVVRKKNHIQIPMFEEPSMIEMESLQNEPEFQMYSLEDQKEVPMEAIALENQELNLSDEITEKEPLLNIETALEASPSETSREINSRWLKWSKKKPAEINEENQIAEKDPLIESLPFESAIAQKSSSSKWLGWFSKKTETPSVIEDADAEDIPNQKIQPQSEIADDLDVYTFKRKQKTACNF